MYIFVNLSFLGQIGEFLPTGLGMNKPLGDRNAGIECTSWN